MNVAAILKHKGHDVFTSTAATTLDHIARILNEKNIGSVVILNDDEQVAGIISERDIVAAIAKRGPAVLAEAVEQSMTCNVYTCRSSDTLEKIMSEMTAHRFRHLPVVEDGLLVGLVSIGDVVKQRIAETEMEAAALRDYIATG